MVNCAYHCLFWRAAGPGRAQLGAAGGHYELAATGLPGRGVALSAAGVPQPPGRHDSHKDMICGTCNSTTRGPARVAWLAARTSCAALVLAGCAAPARPGSAGQPSAGPARPSAAAAAVTCTSATLRIRAGRQGEDQGARGDVEFTNAGSGPCVLRGLPRVTIVGAGGKPLPVRLVRAGDLSLSPVVLAAGRPDAADLVVFWANWCRRPPGPLSVRITLAAGGGVVSGPFNGPPDYNLVPACPSPGHPSTVSVIHAYQPASAG